MAILSLEDDIFTDFLLDELQLVINKFPRYIQNNLKFGAQSKYGNVFAQKKE